MVVVRNWYPKLASFNAQWAKLIQGVKQMEVCFKSLKWTKEFILYNKLSLWFWKGLHNREVANLWISCHLKWFRNTESNIALYLVSNIYQIP